MLKQTPWFERKFDAINDNGLFPNILERLGGTSVRIRQKTQSANESDLEKSINDKWSVKEEIGHLLDLESLWFGRIQDILNGAEELRHADLNNTKTKEANHNAKELTTLITDFEQHRDQLTSLLRTVNAADLIHSALHPRLKTPMRIIDLCFFVAEHDDHHLARITSVLSA